jgi:Restriction Enzyme Adenine Methylase Associated
MGLDKFNTPHPIAEWAFLTDDPAIIADYFWLLAKPALAQRTSPLIEFLARRTLGDVLKAMTKKITTKVNEKLPDGAISQDLIGRWLRDAFPDPTGATRLVAAEPATPGGAAPTDAASLPRDKKKGRGAVTLPDLIDAGILKPPLKLFRKYKGQTVEAQLLPDGTVVFQDVAYATCSQAGEVARGRITGHQMSTNGWTFWQYHDVEGKRHCLDDARKTYIHAYESQQERLARGEQPEL